jgi:hypothetical protein
MTSARLRRWVERELASLHVGGHAALVRRFMALEGDVDFPQLPRYVDGLRAVLADAQRAALREFSCFLHYLVGRTLTFPLDQPKAALGELAELCADLATGPLRGGILQALAEVELLRAFHKIDAPGWRPEIVAGVRSLFPRLADDDGPASELLDIFWRTGFWCGDAELMREGSRLAEGRAGLLRFSGPYWQARESALRGRHDEACALLRGMLDAGSDLEAHGPSWRHYIEVELAEAELKIGAVEGAAVRLANARTAIAELRDPMLLWDLERVDASIARGRGDARGEIAAWRRAFAVIDELGTDRLAAEFALGMGEAATRCGDGEALQEARRRLGAVLPQLRSRAELEPRARALALY